MRNQKAPNIKSCMRLAGILVIAVACGTPLSAQTAAPAARPAQVASPAPSPSSTLPPGYLIGPNDILEVMFWRDKDMSAEVTVRPDGKVSLPLINDIQAAGLTPEEFRVNLNEAASKFKEDPNALVRVKAINSRLVYITGMVAKPASYSMQGGTIDVLQLISMAGGLLDFAKGDKIQIMRRDAKGQPVSFRFNYKEASKGNIKSLKENIQLQPGDTVVVP